MWLVFSVAGQRCPKLRPLWGREDEDGLGEETGQWWGQLEAAVNPGPSSSVPHAFIHLSKVSGCCLFT